MKLYDFTQECFGNLLKQVPLQKRLLSLRHVNSQWTTAVEDACKTQKKLTLQIGRGHQWENIFEIINFSSLLSVKAADPFHCLKATHLSKELTTFLINTFPRLQTLAVIVDDQTEDGHFLHCLPQLISAFTDTLTTLQIVLNVKNVTFHAIFLQLIASIDGLCKLQQLSFADASFKLRIAPFDMPNLLSTSLNTLDFHARSSSNDLARLWAGSLQARSKSTPMQINYYACEYGTKSFSSFMSSKVAIHFKSVFVDLKTDKDLEHFTNVKSLYLTFGGAHSVGSVLTELSQLPQLTTLHLQIDHIREIGYPTDHPLPVLSALQQISFSLHDRCDILHTYFNTESLRPSEVFPNVQQVSLHLFNARCNKCGWQIELPDNDASQALMVTGSEVQLEKCVTKLAAPFAGKAKPKMDVVVRANSPPLMTYTVDFDADGRLKLSKVQKTKKIKLVIPKILF